jgi:dihydroneopterin aldolase
MNDIARPGVRHVFVRDMMVQASIGVDPHEQGSRQRVRVNVDLAVQETGEVQDRLERVVNYARVVERVRALAVTGHTKLVETLAERMAQACLDTDARVLRARVRVEKLDVFAEVGAVGVEVERCKPSTTTA